MTKYPRADAGTPQETVETVSVGIACDQCGASATRYGRVLRCNACGKQIGFVELVDAEPEP